MAVCTIQPVQSSTFLSLSLECSPCFERTCRFGHYNCLRLLEPGKVIAALHSLGGPNLIDIVAEVD